MKGENLCWWADDIDWGNGNFDPRDVDHLFLQDWGNANPNPWGGHIPALSGWKDSFFPAPSDSYIEELEGSFSFDSGFGSASSPQASEPGLRRPLRSKKSRTPLACPREDCRYYALRFNLTDQKILNHLPLRPIISI